VSHQTISLNATQTGEYKRTSQPTTLSSVCLKIWRSEGSDSKWFRYL